MRINLTPAVKQIVIACVVLFLGSMLLSSKINLDTILAAHYPNSPLFKPWQIITHMFMHGGTAHLVFNMLALASLGTTLENYLGTKKFVQLYFLAGLGAILVHFISQIVMLYLDFHIWFPSMSDFAITIDGDKIYSKSSLITSQEELRKVGSVFVGSVVGASGAIYGVAVAFAYLFPNSEMMIMFIPYPIKSKYLIPVILLLDVFLGFSNFQSDPIAHFAHIGGALFGFLVIWYWRKFDRKNFY